MSRVDWHPVIINDKLHPDLFIDKRVMIYEKPNEYFGDNDKSQLIGIATLYQWPSDKQYYWQLDGEYDATLGIQFTTHWAELPNIPEGE